MGITEILLVVLGVLAFVVSFIIPEGLEKKSAQEIIIPDEKISKLIEGRVNKAKIDIEQKTEETISAVTQKAERSMERLSNEKIMAIDEFSHLVLDKINKNHEEAVFLYDMLNNKHAQLKNTMADINKNMESVKKDLNTKKEHGQQRIENNSENKNLEEENEHYQDRNQGKKKRRNKQRNSIQNEKTITMNSQSENKFNKDNIEKKVSHDRSMAQAANDNKEIARNKEEYKHEMYNTDTDIGLSENTEEINNSNNKEKIINLYNEGLNVVDIAKSLGMGIGEVKLIIDLSTTTIE